MDESASRDDAQRFAFSRAVAVAGIAATLAYPVAFYARSVSPDPTHVPLVSSEARGYYVVALLAVIVLAVVVSALDTDDPARLENRYGERVYLYRQPEPRTAWVLPSVVLLTSFLFLAHYQRLLVVILLPLVAAACVMAARVLRFLVMNKTQHFSALALSGLPMLTYVIAFFALAVVYGFKGRALYFAPVTFVVSFLLVMQLMDGLTAPAGRRILYAVIGGLAVAQVLVALNYWNTSMWSGGGLLAAVFFFYASLSRAHLSDSVKLRQVFERGAVVAPLFVILALLAG